MSPQIRLYRTIGSLTIAGLSWLFIERLIPHTPDTTLCLFKWATGIPCPSCGTTSSLLWILQGEFAKAFMLNPLGYLAGLTLCVLPCWLIADRLRNGSSFYRTFTYGEQLLRRKIVFIPCLLVVLLNWYWSIIKMI